MTLPNCRLYLVASSSHNPARLADMVDAAVNAGDVASLLITADGGADAMEKTALAVRDVAHRAGVAVLVRGDADMARRLKLDGVEVNADVETYRHARSTLGADGIVGVTCGTDRHAAMTLGEAGADYCAVDQSLTLNSGESVIQWWASLFTVPIVAAKPASLEEVAALATQGADFVRLADTMWASTEAAAASVRDANLKISRAQA